MSFFSPFLNRVWKRGLFVFLFFAIILAAIQFSFSGLLDTDPYYHIQHAALYNQGLSAETFPWVQLTPYAKNYSDLWYGFHQLLRILPSDNLIFSGKLFVVCIGALVFTVFYLLLTRLKIPKPFFWTAALVGLCPYFLYRLLSLRPHLFDVLFLLACLLFLMEKRRWLLGILMAIFVWFHELAPLLLVVVVLWSATESIANKRLEWKTPLAALIGFGVGIALHPGPVMYLYSMYLVLLKIPIFANLGYIKNFGTEVEANFFGVSGSLIFWLSNFGFLLLSFLAAIILMMKKNHVPSTPHFCLLMITLFWFLLSIVTARGMEWFAPLVILFIAFTVKETCSEWFVRITNKTKTRLLLAIFVFSALLQLHQIQSPDDFKYIQSYFPAAKWLEENTPPQTLVANQWDVFPYLFFENQSNYYTNAYDPIFLYEYDPKLSWLWFHLWAEGTLCETRSCETSDDEVATFDVGDVLADRFHLSYIVVHSQRESKKFLELLAASKRLTSRFTDGSIIVYGPKESL